MDVYILDDLLRRETVIDSFESMIWTERFASYGDFEMSIPSTNESRSLLTEGKRLVINESFRIMVIETVDTQDDSEGRSMLSIKGRSLESILEHRINRKSFKTGGVAPEKWTYTNTPKTIAQSMFDSICVQNTHFPEDNIPFIKPGTMFEPDTLPEPKDIVTIEASIGTVYGAIKSVCDTFGLGFRMTRNFEYSELYFDIYSGNNRTTFQNTLQPVIFSPDLDTLIDVSELHSIANYKNVAYVFSSVGSEVVYAPGIDKSISGFDRRVLMVKADDVDADTDPALRSAILRSRGAAALAENNKFSAIDGTVPQFGHYTYERDYRVGDLVELRNKDGDTNLMRVAEQIFVSDSEGDKSYPTLASDLFITPGTWSNWNPNQNWLDATNEWANA